MTTSDKTPIVSEEAHRAIERRAVANGPILVRESIYPGRVTPHHLKGVFLGDRRRTNPLIVGLTTSDHDWLHANPEVESGMRGYLLKEALLNLCGDDVNLLERACAAVLSEIVRAENDN